MNKTLHELLWPVWKVLYGIDLLLRYTVGKNPICDRSKWKWIDLDTFVWPPFALIIWKDKNGQERHARVDRLQQMYGAGWLEEVQRYYPKAFTFCLGSWDPKAGQFVERL